jgi:hypothetical protein
MKAITLLKRKGVSVKIKAELKAQFTQDGDLKIMNERAEREDGQVHTSRQNQLRPRLHRLYGKRHDGLPCCGAVAATKGSCPLPTPL